MHGMQKVLLFLTIPPITRWETKTPCKTTDGFVPLSLPELKEIMESVILYSRSSHNDHILLDTGAPRSICSEDWLQNANLVLLKRIILPANTPPFRFAGHPICTLYGVLIAASITKILGRQHTQDISVCYLPDTDSVPYRTCRSGKTWFRHLPSRTELESSTDFIMG